MKQKVGLLRYLFCNLCLFSVVDESIVITLNARQTAGRPRYALSITLINSLQWSRRISYQFFMFPLFNWKHENLLNRTWPTEDPRMNAAIIKRSAQDKTIKFVLFNFQVLQNPPRSAMPVCGCRYAARRKSYWNGVDNCFLCKKARYLGSGLFKFKRKASSSVGGSSDRRGKNGISM